MINKIEDIPKEGDTVFYHNYLEKEPIEVKVTWISSLTDNKELLIKMSKHNTDPIENSDYLYPHKIEEIELNIKFPDNRIVNTILKKISTLKQIRDNKLNKILQENNI